MDTHLLSMLTFAWNLRESVDQQGALNLNNRHGSLCLLITALDLSEWRTIMFRHCAENLALTRHSSQHLYVFHASWVQMTLSQCSEIPLENILGFIMHIFVRNSFDTSVGLNGYACVWVCTCEHVCACASLSHCCSEPCEVMCNAVNCRLRWVGYFPYECGPARHHLQFSFSCPSSHIGYVYNVSCLYKHVCVCEGLRNGVIRSQWSD